MNLNRDNSENIYEEHARNLARAASRVDLQHTIDELLQELETIYAKIEVENEQISNPKENDNIDEQIDILQNNLVNTLMKINILQTIKNNTVAREEYSLK